MGLRDSNRWKSIKEQSYKLWHSFWDKVQEEFLKKFALILVGAIVAVFLVFIKADSIIDWYTDWRNSRNNPPRLIYYDGQVMERNTSETAKYAKLEPIAGAEIKIVGSDKVWATSDETGKFCFAKEVSYGDQEFDFKVVKSGYRTESFPKEPAPQVKNDTTTIYIQLEKISTISSSQSGISPG